MRRILAGLGLGLVILLTIGGGLIHGRLSNRWGPSVDMAAAGSRLEQIPSQVGTWSAQSPSRLDTSTREMLESAGDVTCTYIDSDTGAAVHVFIVAGPPGPISEHVSEICFSTQNYQLLGERKSIDVRDASGQEHTLWNVDLRTRELEPRLVRTYYAWSTGGEWMAAAKARFDFAGSPYLYKIQVVEIAPLAAAQQSESAVPRFLQAFLPAAARLLQPAR